MSVFSGKQGKGARAARKLRKHIEAVARQAVYDGEVQVYMTERGALDEKDARAQVRRAHAIAYRQRTVRAV